MFFNSQTNSSRVSFTHVLRFTVTCLQVLRGEEKTRVKWKQLSVSELIPPFLSNSSQLIISHALRFILWPFGGPDSSTGSHWTKQPRVVKTSSTRLFPKSIWKGAARICSENQFLKTSLGRWSAESSVYKCLITGWQENTSSWECRSIKLLPKSVSQKQFQLYVTIRQLCPLELRYVNRTSSVFLRRSTSIPCPSLYHTAVWDQCKAPKIFTI